MANLSLVGSTIGATLWRQGLMVDEHSMDRMMLRVFVANQARVIAAHASSARWGKWLLQRTVMLVANACRPSIFHFHLMAVAHAYPSLGNGDLREFVVVVQTLRQKMQHSPKEVVALIHQGFKYHDEHACTPQEANDDISYVESYATSLARNWF